MANIIIPKTLDATLRRHACNAVNILIARGKLDSDISYDFAVHQGKTYVRFWKGDGRRAELEDRVATVPIGDVISAAGDIPVLEGKSDNLL